MAQAFAKGGQPPRQENPHTKSPASHPFAESAHNAQISVAERALAKKLGHAAAEGSTSAFQGVQKGSAAAVVRDIMSNPARVARGAVTTDVYNAAGQGVRFENATGRFITFVEASKATR